MKNISLQTNVSYTNATSNKNASRSLIGYGQIRQGNRNLYPYAQLADENGNALTIDKDYRSLRLAPLVKLLF